MAARREEDLGGGRASWLVPFDVNVTKVDTKEKVKRGVILAPEGRQIFPGFTVKANLMMGAYLRGKEEAPETIETVLELSLIHILKEASIRGLIQNDPTDFIPRPKKEQSVADCYSPEECRKLLDALHGDPLELPITLAVLYGLRRSEVLGLRWSAIDFERATITISHSVTSTAINGKRQMIAKDKLKRKSSFRTLPLIPQVAATE